MMYMLWGVLIVSNQSDNNWKNLLANLKSCHPIITGGVITGPFQVHSVSAHLKCNNYAASSRLAPRASLLCSLSPPTPSSLPLWCLLQGACQGVCGELEK